MKINKETQEKIQELQALEQSLQAILLQKQAFELELSETENALAEISKSNSDVYKIVGNIMIKFSAEDISKELNEKKEIISLRLKSLEKQESPLKEKIEDLREFITKSMNHDDIK